MFPKFSYIKAEVEDKIAWLTVNRPDKRNALNNAARAELIDAVDVCSSSAEVRVVVITGAGDESFIAGADLAESAAGSVLEQRAELAKRRIYDAIGGCDKPVIAMINGFCLGGGCELALAADIRIACARAKIGLPEINLAMIPGGGGTQRLPRLVGAGQAMRMILTGRPITAEEAYRLGLVEMLTSDDTLVEQTRDLCKSIARHSPIALKHAKQAVKASQQLPLNEGIAAERELFCLAFTSADREEGVRAFMEKRKPKFTGR